MGLSFGSINTGLPKDIVKQLIAADKLPITQMEDRKTRLAEKNKLVTELTDLMQKLQADIGKAATAKGIDAATAARASGRVRKVKSRP